MKLAHKHRIFAPFDSDAPRCPTFHHSEGTILAESNDSSHRIKESRPVFYELSLLMWSQAKETKRGNVYRIGKTIMQSTQSNMIGGKSVEVVNGGGRDLNLNR